MIKEVMVDDVKYKLQKLPVRPALEIRQRTEGVGIGLYEEMLEHVVIEPRMSLDDFDSIGHLDNLMLKVLEFQYEGK